ncbi:hypothetical protein IP86_12640 [Rhodopseudomonas sp. AAP120]|jgi:ribose transport system substrate-binding protein|nr:hypothetical protein IP86_12640 [Rhodopseudomonas sp. AAP120]
MKRFARGMISLAAAMLVSSVTSIGAWAEDVQLLPPGLIAPSSKDIIPEGKFKKAPPWKIGLAFPGVGNTWIVQMLQEMKYEASLNKNIGEFTVLEADWKPAKQVADIEDLMARNVDLLIVAPIAFPVVAAQVDKAVAKGIPVVVFGASNGELNGTLEVFGGGGAFGRVGGEFLAKELKGKGSIWAVRGVAGVGEEVLRYEGFKKAIAGTDIKIVAEVFGDWNYAKSKQLCENLVLSGKPVDGIWFSGAEMTRACIEVFKEAGKPLVPMTGEGNNGFFKIWKSSGVKSVAPVFTPGLGPAVVRASVALLEGKQMYKGYFSDPAPITNADIDKYYRPDLNDAYWVPSTLPEAKLKELFGK